jgi:hypothetical protein
MHFDQIVIAKRPSVGTGSLHNGQVQLLIHEAAVWIPEVSEKCLPAQLKKVVIVPVVNRLSQVHLEEWDPKPSFVHEPERIVLRFGSDHGAALPRDDENASQG